MSDPDGGQPPLFDTLPSYPEWVRQQNRALDAAGFPKSAPLRKAKISPLTPRLYLDALADQGAYNGTVRYLRDQGARAVPVGAGLNEYRRPDEQLELEQVVAVIRDAENRSFAIRRAAMAYVAEYCASPGAAVTLEQVYALAGAAAPGGGGY